MRKRTWKSSWNRTVTVAAFVTGGIVVALLAGQTWAVNNNKMIVIGLDGVDPKIMQEMMDDGLMPNMKKLIAEGDFKNLGTSIPPQSPVAWSNFITGKNPGGHNIFDFIHRDPETYIPYLSTSEAVGSDKGFDLWGDWRIPLGGGEVLNLREGRAFWEYLDEHGVPSTVFKMPANYPPVETKTVRSLSDMGTPDMQGTPGMFSYFTTHPMEDADDVSGGHVYDIYFDRGMSETAIHGPGNPFRKSGKDAECPLVIYRDKENHVAKVVVGDGAEEILLAEGEWSDWVPVEFYMLDDEGFGGFIRPVAAPAGLAIGGAVKFYLKSVAPEFHLYCSPVQIDPMNPAQPVSTPDDWAKDVAEISGRYYTQGMPEDTKALEAGVFTDGEFLEHSAKILEERIVLFEDQVDEFAAQDWGFLFFYFGSLDQQTHMMWRCTDPEHPAADEESARFPHVIRDIFKRLDYAIGYAREHLDDKVTFVIMSDHGFAPWYREVHLNSWLYDNGYVTLKDTSPEAREESDFFMNVDWRRTKAYALGINGLYINLRGREKYGTVAPGAERDELIEELIQKMKEMRDPLTGKLAIKEVYKTDEVFSGEFTSNSADLSVGYNRDFRGSNQSALGEFPMEWFADNTGKWSGDHCIAADLVPGILVTNRKVRNPDPKLYDLTVSILSEFGIEKPEDMIGTPIF